MGDLAKRGAMRKAVFVVSVASLLSAWACVGDSTNSSSADGGDASLPDASTEDGASDASPSVDAGDASSATDASADGNDAGPAILQVDMGDETACALLSDGTVWCWGEGQSGELGTAPSTTISPPVQIASLSNMTAVSVGQGAACAIDKASNLYCWGLNTNGQLGHDPSGDVLCRTTDKCQPTPTKVAGILVKQVSVGAGTTCAVTTSGTAVCFGLNNTGQVNGVATGAMSVPAPTVVPTLPSTIIEVATRFPSGSTCAIDSTNKLYCWGLNLEGQLGHTPFTGSDVNVAGNAIGAPSVVTLNPDGSGGNFDNVAHVHASHTTCAARLDGSVWCWGNNSGAFLGNGAPDGIPHPKPTQVAGLTNIADVRGGNSICALSKTGVVSCWGDYQALVGNNVDAGCTTYFGSADTCTVVPSPVASINAASFDVDHYSAIAIDKFGIANAWGNNAAGELGHTPGTDGDDNALISNVTPKPVVGLP